MKPRALALRRAASESQAILGSKIAQPNYDWAITLRIYGRLENENAAYERLTLSRQIII